MSTALTTNEAVLGKETPRLYTPPLPQNLDKNGDLKPGTYAVGCDHENCDCWSDRTTDGYAAIAFAKETLGEPLFPWQEWLLIHALELIDDGFGGKVYRFRTVFVSVARQNGKTRLSTILALWHLFALHSNTVIGTAQDLSKADDTWRDAVALAEGCEDFEDLFEPEGIFKGHPKTFTLLNGCQYRVASTTGDAGRGFSGDLILLDELRTHKDFKTWSAVTNTMNARPEAQAWAFSNAGDATSVVLRYQRALAHRAMGWPDGEREFDGVLDDMEPEIVQMLEDLPDLNPGWFEWSAPPTARRGELDALSQANPSMNHVEVTRKCPTNRTLLAALASNPPYEYETEVMCRWATMGVGGPFPEGSWEATVSRDARPGPSSIKVVCVEISARRNQTYVARATLDADGNPIVAIRYDHPGTDWVVKALMRDKDSTECVVVRTDGGGSTISLYDEIERQPELRIEEWKGADLNVATGQMFDLLRDRKIAHLPHSGLDMAATSAVALIKPGGGWTVDIRRSPTDVGPLYAAIGAVWCLMKLTAEQYNILESVY
jgi:hypothetical protein